MNVIENPEDELLRITYSEDRLHAYVIFDVDGIHVDTDPEFLLQKLKDRGIIFGVMEHILHNEISSLPFGEEILIAEGVPAIDGKDGWIEYFYDKPEQDNVKEEKRYFVRNVRKKEIIAIVHPPEEGLPGKTVQGEIIAPKSGKSAAVRPGNNVIYSGQSENQLIATEDGNMLIHKDGSVEVQPELVIRGNYDSQMGLLDFVGSVVINGDINPGVTMKVGKKLCVKGTIRDAHIDAGEEVIVDGGFIGKGDGRIESGGKVKLKHIWYQQVITKGDIEVKREIVGGRLRSGGNIIAPDATMAGGLLEAEREIIIKNIGCGETSQGRVRAGVHSGIIERLEKAAGEIKQLHRQTEEVEKVVNRLVAGKINRGSLPDDQEDRLKKLKMVKNQLHQKIEELIGESKALQKRLAMRYEARIKVEERVQENVIVDINGVIKIMQADIEGVEFLERNGSIEIRAL